jgi:DHA2 family multidrug resistance protein-like MFS transporter
MVDVTLFRHRTFAVAIGSNLVISASVVGSLFFVAQYLQSVLGLGPLSAGFHLVPSMLAAMLASIGVVPLTRRGVPISVLLAAALVVAASGFLAMLGLGTEGGGLQMIVANALLGLGGGAAASLGTNLVMAAVPAKRAGAGSAVSETAFELGAALGTAVLGSTLTAVYRRRLELPAFLSAEARQGARETIAEASQAVAALPDRVASGVLDAAQSAFTQGVQAAALLGAFVLVVAAAGAATLLRGIGMNPATADDNGDHERHAHHTVPDRRRPGDAGRPAGPAPAHAVARGRDGR